MSEYNPPPVWPPHVIAGADQELMVFREWIAGLAEAHPHAVQELGALDAAVALAAHIRDSLTAVSRVPADGWGIAAIAVAMLSEHLHPLPMLLPDLTGMEALFERELAAHRTKPGQMPPPLISIKDPDFVTRVVKELLDPANVVAPPDDDDEVEPEPCCLDHFYGCQAPAYPCCDNCPDQGN